jgi:signal transduction histidine kinase
MESEEQTATLQRRVVDANKYWGLFIAEMQYRHSRAELRRLKASRDSAAEDERKRITRELHDDLQQILIALRLNVAAVERQARSLSSEVAQTAAQALALSESAISSTRFIISGLRPQIADDLRLREPTDSRP